MKITPVILSGGMGTRLWPISRKKLPKQFLKLVNNESSFCRVSKLAAGKDYFNDFIVIANHEHRFLVAEELLENSLKAKEIILEPEGLNTCPAISTACFYANDEDIILVLPSDHLIGQPEEFYKAVEAAYDHAVEGAIVTFGIKPDHAATGYGYIKAGFNVNGKISKVEKFVEKPNAQTAEEYIKSRNYFWNAGIFMFKAKTYLDELEKFKPEIYKNSKAALFYAEKDLDFLRLDKESFSKCESISIDYAVMEKTENMIVHEIDCGWQDIGDWQALSDAKEKDGDGNNIIGDVIAENTENSYLHSEDGLLVASGIKNMVIYKTRDVALVADKNQAQNIKDIVERLRIAGRSEYDSHFLQYRPWGLFENIKAGNGFKIKKIIVKPGCKLSMQVHGQRAEHWVVVNGTAKVSCDDKEFVLGANQSTFIPMNSQHRLENIGTVPLEIVEIQTGSYLEEDDIVRLEDDWGREKFGA